MPVVQYAYLSKVPSFSQSHLSTKVSLKVCLHTCGRAGIIITIQLWFNATNHPSLQSFPWLQLMEQLYTELVQPRLWRLLFVWMQGQISGAGPHRPLKICRPLFNQKENFVRAVWAPMERSLNFWKITPIVVTTSSPRSHRNALKQEKQKRQVG